MPKLTSRSLKSREGPQKIISREAKRWHNLHRSHFPAEASRRLITSRGD